MKTTLCIVVKAPVAGRVKTRLSPTVTAVEAAALSAAFFSDTLALARSRDWARVVVACDGDPSKLALDAGVEVWPQGCGDLGERMETVLGRALKDSTSAIAIGTDSPGLPGRFLDSAHSLLAAHDAVVGPCDDGGYYLLGLRRCSPGLLTGLPWSVPETLRESVARLRSRDLSVAETEPWFDVDVPADLARLMKLLREKRIIAPHTGRVLAEITGNGGAW